MRIAEKSRTLVNFNRDFRALSRDPLIACVHFAPILGRSHVVDEAIQCIAGIVELTAPEGGSGMHLIKLASFLAVCGSLTACVESPGSEIMSPAAIEEFALANTSWALVEIDPGKATVDPDLYSLTIRADGSVAFRLDCNRGFGRWTGTSDGEGSSGSIAFSDIGVTKALCSPESISDRVTADLSKFESFELAKDGLRLTSPDGDLVYRWIATAAEQADDDE